jgi:ATP-dependent helicase/nuclease subunit B
LPNDAFERLIAIGAEVFRGYAHRPQVAALWWPRFKTVAAWFVETEQERRRGLARILVEASGEMTVAGERDPFTVTARADRLELHRGGGIGIVDYKTGVAPSAKQVDAFVAPQLPLEGAIARAGGFPGVAAGEVLALDVFRLRGGEPAGEIVSVVGRKGQRLRTVEDGLREAKARLGRLVRRFDDPRTPYPARPQPAFAPRTTDYDHLERVLEWAGAVEEG